MRQPPRVYITAVSLWVWLVIGLCNLLWLPMLALLRLLTAGVDPGRFWVGLWFRKIGVITATLNPLWRFRVGGQLPANPRHPYVVVSNHESFVDILLLSHLPWEMKWLSKVELFHIPILGWTMRLVGDVPVERGTAKSAAKAMLRCRAILRQRVSVVIFPEGTRSQTGEMLPFKDGAFRLAIDAGVPILPIVIHGTRSALQKHDWRVGHSIAEARVLPPVETAGLTARDAPELRDRVRAIIAAEKARMVSQ